MRFRGVIREHGDFFSALLRALDVFLAVSAGALAAQVYLGSIPETPNYPLAILLGALLVLGLLPNFGVYRGWRGESLWRELHTMGIGLAAVFGTLTAFAFITKTGPDYSRVWFLLWAILSIVLLAASRLLLRLSLRALRRKGWNQRRIIIIGSSPGIDDLVAGLTTARWSGLVIRRTMSIDEFSNRVRDDESFLAELVNQLAIDEVWAALPLRDDQAIRHIQQSLRCSSVDLRYVPDISSLQLLNHSLTEVAGFPVINLTSSGMSNTDLALKAIEDRLLAAIGIAVLAPLMILFALGVRMSSPGPILFRQKRWGLNGNEFSVFKFRSMIEHIELPGTITQATKDDHRVTKFGLFLRRTSLDELPQLFNVLQGDMSIVGPRPHAVPHNELYKEIVDKYMARHKIKPGITGWAQVRGYRGETDTVEKMQKRVEHDLYYIENWSVALDLRIILMTLRLLLKPNNAY